MSPNKPIAIRVENGEITGGSAVSEEAFRELSELQRISRNDPKAFSKSLQAAGGTCQYVLACWSLFSTDTPVQQLLPRCQALLAQIAQCEVADRPGRIEPRELKRRRHGYKLMQESRATLRARLAKPK